MDRMKLEQELRDDEGERLTVYEDTRGFLTVGVGHLLTAKDTLKAGERITPEQTETFFQVDIARAIMGCLAIWPAFMTFPEEAQRVFVNMAFNLGGVKLSHFPTMIAAANKKQWQRVACAMRDSLWYTQVAHH